jgi:OOP family OmpA-OmpF porin
VKAAILMLALVATRVPPSLRSPPPAEADRDKDRIPDARDRCPDQPENYNGVEDDDGCPDTGGRVIKFVHKLQIIDTVRFTANSAVLAPAALTLIDAIATSLKAHPAIRRLEITGHEVAGERAGLALARATAVATALGARGVKAELIVHDVGKRQPTCTTPDEACRAQNRQVEFKILSVSEAAASK